MGLDAAVAYPAVTLRLGNPYPFPVVLHEVAKGGVVRAEVLGPSRPRDVTFMRRVDEVLRFAERETPDPALPKGARELKQRGIPGFKITRWRVLREGTLSMREHRTDYYPPTPELWRVGKGPDDPKFEPHDDEHPEYLADEFLTMSEGAGPELTESRTPGKTGNVGWTVREGFARDLQGARAGGRKASAGGAGKPPDAREGID